MKHLTLSLMALALFASALPAEETAAKGRIVSVGLFKNGLAVVRHEVDLPGPGSYRLEDFPEPVHGTYWIEGNRKIETSVQMREVEVAAKTSPNFNLQQELAGKAVTITFKNEKLPTVQGTVVEPERPKHGEPRTSGFLVVATRNSRVYVDASQIAFIEVPGADGKLKERRPVLLLTLKDDEKPGKVYLRYLTRGLAWAPNYRVDISDPKNLEIELHTVIKNELADLKEADISLISGYPSIQFAHVTSPLSLRTSWQQFFAELGQRTDAGYGSRQILSQMAMSNAYDPGVHALPLGATPLGEGVDIHYQAIGKRTLNQGDSLGFTIARGKASYERVVEWLIPDNRDEYGHYRDTRYAPEEERGDSAWDAVRFKNPFQFPMTTAPAMVTANDKFNGQRMATWVNAGEETILRVTKALSVRTRAVEHEAQAKGGEDTRQIVFIGGRRFQKSTVDGELAVSNHRNENISLVIRRRFSGEMLNADGNPKLTLREEGVYSVNRRNELGWAVSLKPGEEKKLTYRYTVLVSY